MYKIKSGFMKHKETGNHIDYNHKEDVKKTILQENL